MPVSVRGVRGATICADNAPKAILAATVELLQNLVTANDICTDDIASAIFTVTPDLNSEFPAKAARHLGWVNVPLMCMQEIPVPGALPHCLRVLLHWNTAKRQDEIQHIYLNGAEVLRPDIAVLKPDNGQRRNE